MIVSVTITGSREAEIGDALRSVAAQVDRVLVVDTGITDATLPRALEAVGAKIAVARHEWKDFSQGRNAALAEAKKLGADWIVVVDSDERIQWNGVDLRAYLEKTPSTTETVFMIESSDGHYPKEKIIRGTANVRWEGPTHEALIGGTRDTLHGAVFFELPKSKEQLERKFSRDTELLYDHVADHPDDPRWWFYLGQSLEGLGKKARAAEAYRRCATIRKGGDEAAWASYKEAEQLFMLNRFEEAIQAAGRGLGAGVMFAECAWMAAISATRLGRQAEAIAWARVAEAVGRFRGCGTERAWFRKPEALYELPYDVLRFVLPTEEGRSQAEADFQAAKLARVGAKNLEHLDQISLLRATPGHHRGEARAMLRPDPLVAQCPGAGATPIRFLPPGGRHAMNPSIALLGGKLACVVRCVNYVLDGRNYSIDDPHGVVRTENYLGTLGEDGTFAGARQIHDLDPAERKPSLIMGYEDIRLVALETREKRNGKNKREGTKLKLGASATVCDRDPARRLIARLDLTPDGDVGHAHVLASRQWHEKNWMPIAIKGQLAWIYSLDPTRVVGAVELEKHCPMDLGHLRGGAAIPLQGGWLVVAHEVIEANEKRVYLHRFVRLSAEFEVTGVTPAWIFAHHGIEFCAGLAEQGSDLVMTYGFEDKEAWMMRVPTKEVLAMKWMTP